MPHEARKSVGGFEILGKIGQGGMGAVFKARQVSMDRVVALKVLPQRLAKNKGFVERFLREARAAAKLDHPNIIQAIDAGHADGYYYFAMEYVEGETLQGLLQRAGALREVRAFEIVRDVLRGLERAHAAGIIHRDVKPDNILITATGQAKLADLGLARETQQVDAGLTQAGTALGTPSYISPEQVRGETELDGRTDLYALGATLYHLLVGRPPYTGGTGNEVMAKHLSEPIPDPRKDDPTVSYEAGRIVRKAMAKESDARYATARDMRIDVEQRLEFGEVPVEREGAAAAAVARRRPGGASRGLGGAGRRAGPGRGGGRAAVAAGGGGPDACAGEAAAVRAFAAGGPGPGTCRSAGPTGALG